MTAWTTPKTWSSGSAVTASELNTHVRDNEKNVDERLSLHGLTSPTTLQPVKSARYGVAASVTGQSTTSAVEKIITFAESNEVWKDAAAMHSDANPARFLPTGAETYLCIGRVAWNTNATGNRAVWFERSDAVQYSLARLNPVSGSKTAIAITAIIEMAADQYVTLRCIQASGSSLNIDATFQMIRVGA